jgi:putative SOS response-associated peptidase YedK
MCGRFTLTADVSALQESFPWLGIPPGLEPRYNVAPTQPVAVVTNDGKNRLDFFTWGLIPSWAKDPSIGSRMINARSETLAEKPSFRSAFRRRRCLVLADGFYEWRKEDAKSKTPMYIRLEDGSPFAFAGLWEVWNAPDGSQVLSTTIITTEPNPLMAKIHNRMPVILPEKAYPLWLQPGEVDPQPLSALLAPYPAEEMVAYPVSKLVNSPANDLPALIEPAG